MANDFVQTMIDARVDARSLSDFMFYPASEMITRRLAPSIHTLNYYLDYLNGLEALYSQESGTVTVNGVEIKTVRQAMSDAIDDVLLGEYQDGMRADLNAQKLDTGITATAKFGGVERTQAEVNADVLSIKDFGATGSYEDTASAKIAFDKILELENPSNYLIHLGNGSGEYRLGEDADILGLNFEGSGRIFLDSDLLVVGDRWNGETNTIYTSPAGISDNSGLHQNNPKDLKSAFLMLKKWTTRYPNIRWRLKFLAGSYADIGSLYLSDFPNTTYPILFEGAEGKGYTGVPTSIFDGWEKQPFKTYKSTAINVTFRNLKALNCELGLAIINGGGMTIQAENIHGEGCSGVVYEQRGGFGEFYGGKITNCHSGVSFQNVYGHVADREGLGSPTFIGNSGDAVHMSRGSVCYLIGATFEDNNIHLRQSKFSRTRTQRNKFGSYRTAAIYQEIGFCLWNDDLTQLDEFTNVPVGSTPVVSNQSAYVNRFNSIGGLKEHQHFRGEAIVVGNTTERIDIGTELSPFRMPGFWLKSPTAEGYVEYEVTFGSTEDVTFSLTASWSNAVLGEITVSGTQNESCVVSFHIFSQGADNPDNLRYRAIVYGDVEATRFGDSSYLKNHEAVSNNSVEPMRCRLYIKRSTGGGVLRIRNMTSKTAF